MNTAQMLNIRLENLFEEFPGHPRQVRIAQLIRTRTELFHRYWQFDGIPALYSERYKTEQEYLKVCKVLATLTHKPAKTYITLYDRRGF